MKMVVLDGYTLNPGDLTWSELEKLGDLTVYDHTPSTETIARAVGAHIVLTNKTILDRAVIQALPDLRYIGLLATGYNVVEVDVAKGRRIPVTNIPTYGTDSVAQMVFALLLELTQNVGQHAASTRAGEWARSRDFCYWHRPLVELSGKTMGLVGYGRIGQATARIARGFGMRVIASDKSVRGDDDGTRMVDLRELLTTSDVVSLHCPLTDTSKHIINGERLSLMKRTAFLINTSRGPLIESSALAEALNSGVIAGAGLDVLEEEPPVNSNPLFKASNCLITPHIAWATIEARSRLMKVAVDNVRAFLNGQPTNVVNR